MRNPLQGLERFRTVVTHTITPCTGAVIGCTLNSTIELQAPPIPGLQKMIERQMATVAAAGLEQLHAFTAAAAAAAVASGRIDPPPVASLEPQAAVPELTSSHNTTACSEQRACTHLPSPQAASGCVNSCTPAEARGASARCSPPSLVQGSSGALQRVASKRHTRTESFDALLLEEASAAGALAAARPHLDACPEETKAPALVSQAKKAMLTNPATRAFSSSGGEVQPLAPEKDEELATNINAADQATQ